MPMRNIAGVTVTHRICWLPPGHRTEATGASAPDHPNLNTKQGGLPRSSFLSHSTKRVPFQLSLFSIEKRATAYSISLLLRSSLPNVSFQRKASAALKELVFG